MLDKNYYKRNSIIKEMIQIDDMVADKLNSMLDYLGEDNKIELIISEIELLQLRHRELNNLCNSLKPV